MRINDSQPAAPSSRKAIAALWTIQTLLALVFLFAGGFKLIVPLEVMQAGMKGPIVLPGWFLRFIGTAEVLGALGLILPGLLRIWRALTPLAAGGLVIIMVGATALTLASGDVTPAAVPLMVGLLAALVAYVRSPVQIPGSRARLA